MAKSKYEYVKQFEQSPIALPQTFMMVRIDGRAFTKMCKTLNFKKPNDLRALNLMNKAAVKVVEDFHGIFLAYGQSDEYSFVFKMDDTTFERRIDKITTCVVSLFSSAYILNFQQEFGSLDKLNGVVPSFDARLVCYPNSKSLRDYFAWRQVDCHINNLYNYCFWLLVCGGVDFENRYGISEEELSKVRQKDVKFREINEEESIEFEDKGKNLNHEGKKFKQQPKVGNKEAEQRLKGTVSSEKIELLWEDYGISYGKDILAIERKGSVILRKYGPDPEKYQIYLDMKAQRQKEIAKAKANSLPEPQYPYKLREPRHKQQVVIEHIDLIKESFWIKHFGEDFLNL